MSTTQSPTPTLLTAREAAALYRISVKHFYAEYLHNPARALTVVERTPGRYLIDAASIHRDIRRRTIKKEYRQ